MAEQVELEIRSAVERIRASFAHGDWATTVDEFERVRPLFKKHSGLRLEATCLASRALVALKEREKARSLLKSVTGVEYKRVAHFEFLARAFLDLRKFDDAARACTKAHAIRQTESTQ